jgi:putative inorganic carbon (HCO3(-)) transporter
MGAVNPLSQNDLGNGIDTTATDSGASKRRSSRGKRLVGPYIALVLFMVIYYGRPEDWIPGLSNVPMAKIAGILALLALVISLRHIRNRFPREVIYLFLLIGQLFLASLFSPVWRGGATMMTLDFAKVLLIVVVMITAVNTMGRLRQLIFVQTASVALIAAVTILKGRVLGGRLEGMLGGNYSNSNDLALAMVISLPLCLGLLFLTRNWLWKAAWALVMISMAYVVFLTGSRGGFISLMITAVVCLWHFAIRGRRRYILALVPLLGVIFWVSSGDMLSKRLNETFGSKDPDTEAYASSEQRQLLFWRSIEMTKQHPLFGVGPGNFEQVSGVWHETHNAFTQLSSEGGLPALILYVLILWHGFMNIRRTKRLAYRHTESRLLAGTLHASLIGYIVGSMFASVGFQFFPYILVAYTAALLSIAKYTSLHSQGAKSVSQSTLKSEEYIHTTESDLSWNLS